MRDCSICFLICEIAPRCVPDLVLDTLYMTGVSLGFPFEKGSHTVAQASLNLTSDPPGMFPCWSEVLQMEPGFQLFQRGLYPLRAQPQADPDKALQCAVCVAQAGLALPHPVPPQSLQHWLLGLWGDWHFNVGAATGPPTSPDTLVGVGSHGQTEVRQGPWGPVGGRKERDYRSRRGW